MQLQRRIDDAKVQMFRRFRGAEGEVVAGGAGSGGAGPAAGCVGVGVDSCRCEDDQMCRSA